MTTTVKIEVHCASTKQVIVETQESDSTQVEVLQDGESATKYAYDAKRITVYEQDKGSI